MRTIPISAGGVFLFLSISLLFLSAGVRADNNYPYLRDTTDPVLQLQLERSLRQLNLSEAVRAGRLALSLVDITDLEHPRLAAVNGDLMLYSASLPKIAILLAAFQKINDGSLPVNTSLQEDLVNMIRYSSNQAATRVLNGVGPDYLNGLLQSERYRLYDVNQNGGLWVGKPYGKSPAYQRDPLHAISHGATAIQVARFYYLLEAGKLVSPQACVQMKEILSHPQIRHKFVAGLYEDHPDAAIYRKSGTWRTYHSDSAIVEHDGRRYIAVALANDANGEAWLRQIIKTMDRLIFTRTYVSNG